MPSDHFTEFEQGWGLYTNKIVNPHASLIIFKADIDDAVSACSKPTDWNNSWHKDIKVFSKVTLQGNGKNKKGGGSNYIRWLSPTGYLQMCWTTALTNCSQCDY